MTDGHESGNSVSIQALQWLGVLRKFFKWGQKCYLIFRIMRIKWDNVVYEKALKIAKLCINIHCDIETDSDQSKVAPEWIGVFLAPHLWHTCAHSQGCSPSFQHTPNPVTRLYISCICKAHTGPPFLPCTPSDSSSACFCSYLGKGKWENSGHPIASKASFHNITKLY